MADKIKPLELAGDYKSHTPKLTLRAATYVYYSRKTVPFDLSIEDEHFNAYRTLTVEELEAIRDWCNVAIEAAWEAV
jgi:hypothetical protein